MSLWSDFWDTISGNKQQQQARKAIEQKAAADASALQQQIQAAKEAQAQEQAFQMEMLNKMLAENRYAQNLGLQQAQFQTGANLSDMFTQLALAQASQQANMPNLQAQQAMLNQSLPMIMAMAGGTPVQMPDSVQTVDYNSIAQNLIPNLQNSVQQVAPIFNQVFGMNGTGGATAPGSSGNMTFSQAEPDTTIGVGAGDRVWIKDNKTGQMYWAPQGMRQTDVIDAVRNQGRPIAVTSGGQFSADAISKPPAVSAAQPTATAAGAGMPNGGVATKTTPIQYGKMPNISELVMNNPEYKLKDQTSNEALNRRLSGMGMQNSSDALYMQGRLAQQNLADAYNSVYNKQLDLYRMASGMNPMGASMSMADKALGQIGSLGSLGDASSGLQQAAAQRSNMYQNQANKGSSAAELTNLIGQLQAQNSSRQGENAAAWYNNNKPENWLDRGIQIWSDTRGGGWPGGGNSSDLDWWTNLTKGRRA